MKHSECPLKYVLFNLYFAERESKRSSFSKRISLTSKNCCLGNCFLTGTTLVARQMFLLKCLSSSEFALPCFCGMEIFMALLSPTDTAKDCEKEERESGAK